MERLARFQRIEATFAPGLPRCANPLGERYRAPHKRALMRRGDTSQLIGRHGEK
jgi:hypothetical protein